MSKFILGIKKFFNLFFLMDDFKCLMIFFVYVMLILFDLLFLDSFSVGL